MLSLNFSVLYKMMLITGNEHGTTYENYKIKLREPKY